MEIDGSRTKTCWGMSDKVISTGGLSKAAIYSAAALMLERVGLGFEDLDKVYIAGSFGRFLDLDQAITIGMIPDIPRDRYRYLGNASLTGTSMTLVSRSHRQRQLEIAHRMTNIELSTIPEYMDHYTAALFLPHTDSRRFPSIADVVARDLRP
jgi:uncharacterized 2Fe-2S/4Fe-4S cluster protein (DUF4445 family)